MRLLPCLVPALLLLTPAAGRADDWEKLGTRVVAFAAEKDTIDCTGDGRFNAIKIDVEDGNIEMYDIKITFGNGDPFKPETRFDFNEGTRSRTIDLPGEARAIRTIEFWYKSKFRKGRATVTVFGRKAGGGGDPKDPPRVDPKDDNKGWELLGIRVADFGAERDTIDCTGEGKFRSIKIEVEDGNLEMYNVKVTFGNDESYSPDTRFEFKEGTRTRIIDLPGEARNIRKVEFWYRSELRKGKARIRLYGSQAGGTGGGDKEEKWEKLGSRQVDFGAEKDTINCAGEGTFNAIRLDVEEGNLEMYNIKVTFQNDETWSPDTRYEFKQGSMSRTIDLPGTARNIRKIEFWYRSEFKKGRATIHVFGRHAAGGGGDVKPEPPKKDPRDRFPGWEHLGSRVVDFGGDHDAIDCRGEGRFSAFQVEVENGDLEIFDVVVTFGNGDKESPRTRLVFGDDARTRVIDLPGNKRFIKRIDFYYKSIKATRDGKATINVYGKK